MASTVVKLTVAFGEVPLTIKPLPKVAVVVPETLCVPSVTVSEPPLPEPQSEPVPEIAPAVLTCRHCVEPVIAVVTVPVADKLVKAPAAGAVPPIAGGDAKSDVKPAPLTVPLAESVVNAPAFGVVPPMAGGVA